jgi:hypothetical protein
LATQTRFYCASRVNDETQAIGLLLPYDAQYRIKDFIIIKDICSGGHSTERGKISNESRLVSGM